MHEFALHFQVPSYKKSETVRSNLTKFLTNLAGTEKGKNFMKNIAAAAKASGDKDILAARNRQLAEEKERKEKAIAERARKQQGQSTQDAFNEEF